MASEPIYIPASSGLQYDNFRLWYCMNHPDPALRGWKINQNGDYHHEDGLVAKYQLRRDGVLLGYQIWCGEEYMGFVKDPMDFP